MKKPIVILLVVFGIFSGGYLLLLDQSKRAAIDALENFNKTLQRSFGDVQITYDDIRTNIFQRSAIAEELVLSVSDNQIIKVDEMVISGEEGSIRFANLSDLELSFMYDEVQFKTAIGKLFIEELKLGKIQSFLNDYRDSSDAILFILDELSISKFELEDFSLIGTNMNDEPIISLSGGVFVDDLYRGTMNNVNAIELIIKNRAYSNLSPFDFETDNIEISNFELKPFFEAFNSEQKEVFHQLNHAFGITKLDIEKSSLFLPDRNLRMLIGKGDLEIENSFLETFTLEDFVFQEKSVDTNVSIGEMNLKGLDLSIDFLSQEILYENVSRVFGVEEFFLKDVSILYDEIPLRFAEFGFSEIETKLNQVISGKTFMYDLEIPFSEIEEINQKLVEEIVLTTGLDKLKASFQTEFHYDEDDKRYSNSIKAELDQLAEIEFSLEMAEFDPISLKELEEVPSSILLAIFGEEIEFRKIKIDYNDFELADILFKIYPQIIMGIDFIKVQASLLLYQYPNEKELLISALNNFGRERNKFGLNVLAVKPLRMSEVSQHFASGRLNEYVSIEAYGN